MNAEYDNIMNRLGDIEIQAAKIEQIVTSSHKAFKESEARASEILEKHNSTLYGNGKHGLTSLHTIPGMLENHIRNDMWSFGIMISLLLSILGWTVFHT
jgi:hypothetical protein